MNFTVLNQSRFRKFLPAISIVVLFSFLHLVIGCSYYKVTTPEDKITAVNQMPLEKKYLVLHHGNDVWHLTQVQVDDDKKEMTGVLHQLSPNSRNYLDTDPNRANRYKKQDGNPSNEVHIYISEYLEGDNSQITFPLSSIEKLEVYDEAMGATVASYTFTTLGIIAGVIVIIGIIAFLTKSSCPFVYVSNGKSYQFTGEMYGGAIYSSLERDDFMPLPNFSSSSGTYQLKITNELLERQYTNLAELIVVQHPENSSVIIDKNGELQTITSPLSPTRAVSNKIYSIDQVLFKDNNSFLFNDGNPDSSDFSSLTLSFKKPVNLNTGKLILNAKNSFWLDYIYGKFTEKFGFYYNTFAEKQKKVPAKKNIQWSLEQGIPLSVYVETHRGWEFVDYFNLVGPLASRDLVMAVDLKNVKGDDVKIKLECGFMFWEVDYAAMDFTENISVEVKNIVPSSAIDEKGVEVSALLSKTDNQYLIQPEVGNEVIVTYDAPISIAGHIQTTFLHSRGYYEYIRDYKTMPDLLSLNSFKEKGAFTSFSKQRYFEFIEKKDLYSTALNTNDGN